MGWREEMRKAADEGDEEAKKFVESMDGDGDEKKDDDKKESKSAEDSEPEKKDDEKKDDEKKEAKTAARVSLVPTTFDLAATVQDLSAWKAQQEEATERSKLMAARPDLAPEVTAWLAAQPIETVRSAVEKFPKGKAQGKQIAAARAAVSVGVPEIVREAPTTTAAAADLPMDQPSIDMRAVDARLGLSAPKPICFWDKSRYVQRACTPAEARAELARRAEAEAKKGAVSR